MKKAFQLQEYEPQRILSTDKQTLKTQMHIFKKSLTCGIYSPSCGIFVKILKSCG